MRTLNLLLAAAAVVTTVAPAHAAKMWRDKDTVYIDGQIARGDLEQFKKVSAGMPRGTIVAMRSPGGELENGVNIALNIRSFGFRTVVVDSCASVCGLMWLAGVERAIFDDAQVGFHSAYELDMDDKPVVTGGGNAVVGAVLAKFGFSLNAIEYLTDESPENMEWLSPTTAKKYDIKLVVLPSQDPRSNREPNAPVSNFKGYAITLAPAKTTKRGR